MYKTIKSSNHAALGYQIPIGADVRPFFLTGSREYAEFQGGCLYLTLQINEQNFGVSVTRMDGFDVFIFEDDEDRSQLQAMALAARELRGPLAGIMTTADRLFPMEALEDDPKLREQAARLNRGLYQMLRIIGNMSDAGRSDLLTPSGIHDLRRLFRDIFEKISTIIIIKGIGISFM